MKKKEIHLTSEEIDYLLKGTIHWEDIARREDTPFRKPMDSAANKSHSARGFIANPSSENQEEIISQKYFVEEKIPQEAQPFWSGAKVYIVLSFMLCITLGTWAYFVFT